nr:EAL domain-containing protein [Vibrio sinaloensis]
MAFQPIYDVARGEIFAYEALVRGNHNEPALHVLSQVNEDNKYAFDQECRAKAIKLASSLGMDSVLSINFLPNAIYEPERCMAATLRIATKYQFPTEKILFEFTEVEKLHDVEHVKRIIDYYNALGFMTAIDDFGAGYSGLNLLAEFHPTIAKIDMSLIRGIDHSPSRQVIVKQCVEMFRQLDVIPLAEGVETKAEFDFLNSIGISLQQGYFIAKPEFEALPEPNLKHMGLI